MAERGRRDHILRHVGKNSRTNPKLMTGPKRRADSAAPSSAQPAFDPPGDANRVIPPKREPRW